MLDAPAERSTLEILADLVSFDTVSDRSNLEMAGYVEALAQAFGGRVSRVPSDDGRKTNLLVSIGPMAEGGLVLSGHTDVVPVEGQRWTSDPFKLRHEDGKVFGRGTVDMKGFLAVCLSAMSRTRAHSLRRPLHLALSYDEEVGCFGVVPLVEHIVATIPTPQAVIVGEPTTMDIVNAHKSAHDFRTLVRGRAAHSSVPFLGSNAIFAAASLIRYLADRAADLASRPVPHLNYDAPYTTISSGLIRGGEAGNIVPAECTFNWEIRSAFRGEPETILESFERFAAEQVLSELRRTADEATVSTTQLCAVASLEPEPQGVAEQIMMALVEGTAPRSVSFCTEAGLFQKKGLSTVVCGPGRIEQAHQPDEFIEISQLERCEAILLRAVSQLC